MKRSRGAIQLGFLLLFVVLVTSCSSPRPPFQTRKLPSGRTVKIQGIVQMHFTQGNPALMLRYETDLKITNKDALRTEADDIWSVFRYDVEKSGFKTAMISASEVPHGFIITTSNGYNFVYQRQADGTWRRENDEPSK